MHKLLFIHSDPKLVGIYKKSLGSLFLVDSAFDGLQGLRMIKSTDPNLIISDYHLPHISGASLLSFVRANPKTHRTPFIFFSHVAPEHDGLGLGATDWIVIPQTNPEILAAKCLNHLRIKTYV